jgi:16S rRNA (guanine527-N7)-methyltransferase
VLPEQEFLEKSNVSRETYQLYQAWQQALLKWNKRINLVARSTLPDFWSRHALDSWQVTPFINTDDVSVLDFGSGAGFPGIAVAIALKDRGGAQILMAESAGKKASFLRSTIRELELPAKVHAGRIEDIEMHKPDIITARAFAPLPRLLEYAAPFLSLDTRLILLKGESVDEEIKAAHAKWTFGSRKIQSHTDQTGCVLLVENIKRL